MGRIIGIDLGTTYSAVAIPEANPGGRYFTVRECPGYAVLTDKLKRRIIPSVVAEDSRGEIVVGHTAKGRAGLSPEPIMFSKRWMGEDKTFQLARQGELRPEAVAGHILRYLKEMAEDCLGEPVTEAVITVPAYFTLRAKQMTEQAGAWAGLRVMQVAQEPVAAALMYCVSDERDPLRIMTYDLGGGTFDVAVVERRDGAVSDDSVLAFDGNRFLGGYNFDRKLAFWLADELCESGYDLALNLDNSTDREIFAKLMVYAERAKIALSKSDSYEFQEPSTGINDRSGNPVTIENLGLTRAEFEQMIAQEVEETMQLCRRALCEKAGLKPSDLHEILLVGGSSRIPYIARRLEAEFGRLPRLVEPDLCVALGAAILAGTKPQTVGCLKLDSLPNATELTSLTVSGRVVPGGSLTAVAGCAVLLRALDGSHRSSRAVGTAGEFVFSNVPLAEEMPTDFVLTVTTPTGAEVAKHNFSVTHSSAPSNDSGGFIDTVGNVLSKPIFILLADGPHEIAPERTPLPYETSVGARTTDTSGKIQMQVLEEHNPLGWLLMEEIPTTLAVGSAIDITLTIQENYQISARAYIPSLAREKTAVIDIPVRPQKGLAELRRDYEMLAARADDALSSASLGGAFSVAKRLRDQMGQAEEMLHSRAPEPAAIQDRLDEIESLVRKLSAGWRPEPPRAVLDAKCAEAEHLLQKALKKRPAIAQDRYDKQLEAIAKEAQDAYTKQDTVAWKDSFNKLVKLCDRLEKAAGDDDDNGTPPDPAAILLSLERELATLEAEVRTAPLRYTKFRSKFQELAADLQRIDPQASDAMLHIRDWYRTKYLDLRRRLDAPDVEGFLELDDKRR